MKDSPSYAFFIFGNETKSTPYRVCGRINAADRGTEYCGRAASELCNAEAISPLFSIAVSIGNVLTSSPSQISITPFSGNNRITVVIAVR